MRSDSGQHVPVPRDLKCLYDDIEGMLNWTQEEIFELDTPEVEALQLHWLQRRYQELRPRLKALDNLARNLEIDMIQTLDDVIPLCFPHTMFKSYSTVDIEKHRFERLTRWLETMTTEDLSVVDSVGLKSFGGWVERIQASTALELHMYPGANGKVSILPKTANEARHLLMGTLRVFLPYRDEPGFDPRQGEATYVTPWPARTGPHHVTQLISNMTKYIFGGREDRVITLGQGDISADALRLTGKLRRAEMTGVDLRLTDFERELAVSIREQAKGNSASKQMDLFIEHALVRRRGSQIFMMASWQQIYELARACKVRGVSPDLSPKSMLCAGGGIANWPAADGWRECVEEIFPIQIIELYGMTECSATSRLCSAEHWHAPPWGISWIVDPRNSKPYPRTGVQTGRHVCFDLLSKTYWAGTLSGDKMTMHWDGGCACGRKGPYAERDVRRFTQEEGGDDKISCSKAPNAYENLVKFAAGVI